MDPFASNPLFRNNQQVVPEKSQLSAQSWPTICKAIFEQSDLGILVTDPQGDIQFANSSFTDLTGYPSEEIVGKNPRFLKSGVHEPKFYRGLWESVQVIGQWQGKIFNLHKDGKVVPHHLTILTVKDGVGQVLNYVGLLFDLTAIQDNEEFFQHVATHDPLTNLPNRSCFYDELNKSIYEATIQHSRLAVLFIDLDGFKGVNDTYGHELGDQLLLAVADRLQTILAPKDMLSRMGGDEFTIIMGDIQELTDASNAAEAAIHVISQPYLLYGTTVQISASIGISLFPGNGENADQLLQSADQAMYAVKDGGKNSYRFFSN